MADRSHGWNDGVRASKPTASPAVARMAVGSSQLSHDDRRPKCHRATAPAPARAATAGASWTA